MLKLRKDIVDTALYVGNIRPAENLHHILTDTSGALMIVWLEALLFMLGILVVRGMGLGSLQCLRTVTVALGFVRRGQGSRRTGHHM